MSARKRTSSQLKPKQPMSQKKLPQQNLTNISVKQKTKNILASVQEKLLDDLQKQSINIPTKSIPFTIVNQNSKKQASKQQWLRLQKIIQQKQQMKKKLIQIEKNQQKLKSGLNLLELRQKSLSNNKLRCQLSTDDITQLKKLKKQQIRYEKQLQEKTKTFQQNQKSHKLQQQELTKKKIEQTNQKKKMQISKRLQQLSLRQIERRNKFEEDKKNLAKVKLQKRLHEQLMQKWQKIEKQNQEKKRLKYEQAKKQKSIDFSELKQHEKKYEQIIKKNKDDLSRKRLQASQISNKIFKHKLHQSKFYTLVVQQQQKRKKEQQIKRQALHDLSERKKQFAQIIKLHFAPKMKIKSEQNLDDEEKKTEIKKNALEPIEFRKKGLEYLQQSKSKAVKNKSKDQSFSFSKVSQIPQEKTPPQKKYYDYLKQTRKNRQQTDGKSLRLQRNFQIQVDQAKRIMKQTSFSDQQKIERVKMLAQRMQFDPKTTKSSTLLKKIQAKMQILQSLQ